MDIREKIDALVKLGNYLEKSLKENTLDNLVSRAITVNPWFTRENINQALEAITKSFLGQESLDGVVSKYAINGIQRKRVGLVLAGNIPAVGFHDILCTFLCNHISLIKYSSKDDILIPHLLEQLANIDPRTSDYFIKTDRLKDFDAVIATGGNNTSRYFEYYFKEVDHIIRKSRTSISVLDGHETDQDLIELGKDITSYFGLGCRNVSKIYIPKGYDLKRILKVLDGFSEINNHHKYRNNYDYNMALFLLNKESFLNNSTLLLKESKQIPSRIACLHYEEYDDDDQLTSLLKDSSLEIQCVVGNMALQGIEVVPFGMAQKPSITDYADGVDTIQFLLSI